MKLKCVTTLALSLQPRPKTLHKMYPRASQDKKWISLSGKGPYHPPRCGKSLGIKEKHPYLILMVNSLIWKLRIVNNPKCLNVDFKG
jgi:hypothetical protein